jgi:predicted phosphodiesterase
LGSRAGVDVLRRPEVRAGLVEQLSDCDRLVLLGDVLELRTGPLRDALKAAEPVLRELGAALGAGREVVLVPGNHDHHLLAAWLARRARDEQPPPLGLESSVGWEPEDPLGTVASWLAPAQVRAAYPGVWLRDDVYAIHGHYADRHTTVPMFERLGVGVMARIVHDSGDGRGRAEDYEATLTPIYAWIHAVAQNRTGSRRRSTDGASSRAWSALRGGGSRLNVRRTGMKLAFPAIVGALNRARLGPLRADLSGPELRRASLLAIAAAIRRLDVGAAYVIFGHTHRAGPLPTDDASEWRMQSGAELLNIGCWVYEQVYLGHEPSSNPYRPGFCAIVDDHGPPALRNLLDGAVSYEALGAAVSRAPAPA